MPSLCLASASWYILVIIICIEMIFIRSMSNCLPLPLLSLFSASSTHRSGSLCHDPLCGQYCLLASPVLWLCLQFQSLLLLSQIKSIRTDDKAYETFKYWPCRTFQPQGEPVKPCQWEKKQLGGWSPTLKLNSYQSAHIYEDYLHLSAVIDQDITVHLKQGLGR